MGHIALELQTCASMLQHSKARVLFVQVFNLAGTRVGGCSSMVEYLLPKGCSLRGLPRVTSGYLQEHLVLVFTQLTWTVWLTLPEICRVSALLKWVRPLSQH